MATADSSSSSPTEIPNSNPNQTQIPKYLQELYNQLDLTQECLDLISTLPKEAGWILNNLHQYRGFWHTKRQVQAILTCQTHFKPQNSDIILVTTPKSGTTWLKAITFALINRTEYQNDHFTHPLLTQNPHDLVPYLELNLYVDNQIPDLSSLTSPRLFATHLPLVSLPLRPSSCKLIYLCRNPKDTFVSLWHFSNKLRPKEREKYYSMQEDFDKFCRGVSLYGPFWDHVLGYYKASLENPERVMFLKFEELKQRPRFCLRNLAEFLGRPFSAEEENNGVVDEILKLCSFENLSSLEVNQNGKFSSGHDVKVFFRRGEVGDWVNHLTDEMIERIDRITEEKFHGTGLKF